MSLKHFLAIALIINSMMGLALNITFAQQDPSPVGSAPSANPQIVPKPSNPNPAASFITLSNPSSKPAEPTNNTPQPATNTVPNTPDSSSKNTTQTVDDKLIVIGTGAVTGIYYPAGGAICRLINKDRKSLLIRCAVESTAGSIYNISALQNAEIDFAIIQSDWEDHAYNGTGYFAKLGRVENLRHVFSLHNEAFTVIVQKKATIQKFDDIKGHIVNIGPEGSGVRATMEDIMKAKGWTKQDFKSLAEYKPNEQSKALCDGRVDALVLATGHPSGAIQEVTSLCETRIINVNDEIIQKFVMGNPELATTIIPGGMYVGIPNDVTTFGVKANFVTTTDMSDTVVYNVTKTVFENLPAFKALHPVFQQLEAAKMVKEGRIAPFHDGALKYYREKGLVPQ